MNTRCIYANTPAFLLQTPDGNKIYIIIAASRERVSGGKGSTQCAWNYAGHCGAVNGIAAAKHPLGRVKVVCKMRASLMAAALTDFLL
jgi:hypothetical protein